MRLFIAAIVAVIVGGCAGSGPSTSTLETGSTGKNWTNGAFESKGSE
jgi:hypothetical protein